MFTARRAFTPTPAWGPTETSHFGCGGAGLPDGGMQQNDIADHDRGKQFILGERRRLEPQVASPTPSISATSAGGVPIPPAPADPVAAAAWEALMSPVGEYAAAASYQAVITEFGPVEPYVSIQAAEERHIDALIRQLQRFGITVPANPYAGRISAPADLSAAAGAWAAGEVNNVAMYDRLLATIRGDAGMTRVFSNLRRAWQEMHLPAFRAAAEHGGQLTKDQMRELGMG